jgi:O-glycosyl hydrolase
MAIVTAGVSLALGAMSHTVLAGTATVRIDWNDTQQTIDGFGTSQGAGYAPYLKGWPEAQSSQIMDLAFSQEKGIGLTIFRSQIPPELEPSKGVWDDNADFAQVWMMQEAVKRGPVKLIATVASPPAWMKSNGSIFRGELGAAHYQDFADYLSRYTREYAAKHGVNIYALSMTNEPDTIFGPDEDAWATCAWSPEQIELFLRMHLGPTFARDQIASKVIGPEPANWDEVDSFMSATYGNPSALARVDIVAGHLYGGVPSRRHQQALDHGKPIWQTEASMSHDAWGIDGALSWAKTIHDSLTGAQVSAWIWWGLALWGDNPPDEPSQDQFLIGLNFGDHSYKVSKTLWALGNFSKFIRPGFVRLGTTTSNAPMLHASAYKDPTNGQLVIVVINRNASSQKVRFDSVGFSAGDLTPYVTSRTRNLQPLSAVSFGSTLSVPARSIMTYVSRPLYLGQFDAWASAPNARAVSGDFNGDGRADIALVGAEGWITIPVAFSQGDGTFSVSNAGRWDFAGWASAPGAQVVSGDVNGDGRADLIATGGSGWWTIPVAYSNGDGTFEVSNLSNWPIPEWAQAEGVKALAGDVDGDGRADLILTGGAGWWTIPVGFSNGDGTFRVTNHVLDEFPIWAQDPYAQASAADLNGDGRTDIVLAGGADWITVPMAFSRGDGSFWRDNRVEPNMSIWSQGIGAKLLTGDVNGDLRGDVVLTGGADWITIPVGFSNGNGTLSVSNAVVPNFPTWAQDPSAKAVAGDFNGDGRADLALVGGNDWWTVPVAFANGDGTFTVTNFPVP